MIDNDLNDLGVKLLAESLKGNTSLTQMDFSETTLGKNGAVFIQGIAECTNLTALSLDRVQTVHGITLKIERSSLC